MVRPLLKQPAELEKGGLVVVARDQLNSDRESQSELNPAGRLIAGEPVRFAVMVKMSDRYIWSGSSLFWPNRNAGVGLVGINTASTSSRDPLVVFARMSGLEPAGRFGSTCPHIQPTGRRSRE